MSNKKGLFLMVLCYLIWGMQPLYWSEISEFNSAFILCVRVIMSIITLFIYLAISKRLPELWAMLKDKSKMKIIIPAAVFIAIDWGLFIWGVTKNHVLDLTVGYYMNPLIIFLSGLFIFKEKSQKRELLAVLVAFSGVLISIITYGSFPLISMLAATFWPLYAMVKKFGHLDPIISVAAETLILSPFAVAVMLIFFRGDGGLGIITPSSLPYLLFAGIITALPMILYTHVENHLPFKTVGVFQYLGTTITLVCGAVFMKEEFTPTNIIMLIFIWAGLIIYTSAMFKKEKSADAEA
ncbi:EamA family transporter RarD [Clostridiaceae bacterium OttesenSCG-928-D20]|nr:EamA family transporter RarD [Clostridiaceae bacterium OttesenSCG-928-D20]